MEKIKQIIQAKQNTLDDLNQEKSQLQHNMSNPQMFSDNLQKIEKTQKEIDILHHSLSSQEETNPNVNAKDLLINTKNKLEECRRYEDPNEEGFQDLERDIRVVENIINTEFSNSENVNTIQENSTNTVKKEPVDLEDSADITNFDDF